MYGGSVKELYTLYSSKLKQRQTYWFWWGRDTMPAPTEAQKSQVITMPFAKKKRKLGSSTWTSVGSNAAPDPPGFCSPSKGVSFTFLCPCSPFFCWNGHCHSHTLSGRDIFSVFLLSAFISFGASSPHRVLLILLKGKHWFESASKVAAGICDYLMGLVDYEKACLLWGSWERENGQVDAWMWLSYAWNPDGHFGKARSTGSDGQLQVRIGTSSQQAGKSLDCPTTCRWSRIKYFSQGRWQKPSSIAHSYDKYLTKAAFLLHQTALLQNSFAAWMQTEPRGILTDTFCC